MALRTARAGSHMSGRSSGSAIFMSGCARGFSASLASPVSAADLTATLAPSKARSPAQEPLLESHHCHVSGRDVSDITYHHCLNDSK